VPDFEVQLFLDANLQYNSYIIRGFSELADNTKVHLTTHAGIVSPTANKYRGYSVLIMKIRKKGERSWKIAAYDARDQNDQICPTSMGVCDIYFKVNHHPASLSFLNEESYKRVRPIFPIFPVHPFIQTPAFYRHLPLVFAATLAPGHFITTNGRITRKSLRGGLTRLKQVPRKYLLLKRQHHAVEQVEGYANSAPTSDTIYYRPRVYQDNYDPAASEHRAAIVRILKAEFKNNYVGGFRPTKEAFARFPDLIDPSPDDQTSYFQKVAKSDIVINTNGMYDAFGWKLPEYMAMGRCILSQELVNETQVPMQDGKEVIFFKDDLSDFAPRLQALLNDRELRRHLAENARSYYARYLKPVKQAEYILNTLFDEQFFAF